MAVTDFAQPNDLNQVVDALLAAGADRAALQSFVVEQYPTTGARPSSALRALARVPSRIVVTFNYDRLIEAAADLEGIAHRSFTHSDLPYPEDLEVGADHELYVVHLHGVMDDPSSLVLDAASYGRIANDQGVRDFITT